MRPFVVGYGVRVCVALALLGAAMAQAQEQPGMGDQIVAQAPAPASAADVPVVSGESIATPQWEPPASLSSLLRVDPWTTEQKVWAGVSTALILTDWGQTRYIAKNPDRFHETNPLIGRHPSMGEVNRHFALSMAANLAVASLLPSKWRTNWLMGVSGMQAYFVIRNKRLGIRMAF